VRSWLSLLGGNASTNVVETQTLGIFTIELALAPASILMQGTRNHGVALVDVATSSPFRTEVNRGVLAANTAAITAAIPEEPASYNLSDLQFRIVRYLMPREFYDSIAHTLGNGGVYKLWFPNYSVYTGNPVLATNIVFIPVTLYLQQIKTVQHHFQ
jgi:hypothetical protein